MAFDYEVTHFNDGLKISQADKQRDIYIAYESDCYMVILLENNEMVETRRITDFQLIPAIVADWIHKGK